MKKQELCIYAPEGDYIARLWFDGKQIACSEETSALFKEAVEYLLQNEQFVIYTRDSDVVAEQLFGHSEKSLEVLKRYYRFSMGYNTDLMPCLDIDIAKSLEEQCKETHGRGFQIRDEAMPNLVKGDWQTEPVEQLVVVHNDSYSEAA